MKTLRILAIIISLVGIVACSPGGSGSSSPAPTPAEPFVEFQYKMNNTLGGVLNYKEVAINTRNNTACSPHPLFGGITPETGIGLQTQIVYNTTYCRFDTKLVKNYRLNYYYLEIRTPAPLDGCLNPPNKTECNELIGNYWIHHNGQDSTNLYNTNEEMSAVRAKYNIPFPTDLQVQWGSRNLDVFERIN